MKLDCLAWNQRGNGVLLKVYFAVLSQYLFCQILQLPIPVVYFFYFFSLKLCCFYTVLALKLGRGALGEVYTTN